MDLIKNHWSFPEKKYLVSLVESTVIEYGVFNNDVSRIIIRSIDEKILVLFKKLWNDPGLDMSELSLQVKILKN